MVNVSVVSKRVLLPLTATLAAPASLTSLIASTVKVGVIASALLEVNASPVLPVASLKPCSVNATLFTESATDATSAVPTHWV